MRENYALVFQLYAEKPARELLQHRTGYFYAVLFAHKPPKVRWAGRRRDRKSTRLPSDLYALVFQLYAEKPARELLQHRTGYFYAVLFAHKPPKVRWAGRRSVPPVRTPRPAAAS